MSPFTGDPESASRGEWLPLMESQRGMVTGHLTDPANPAYGAGVSIHFTAAHGLTLDHGVVVEACRRVLRETPALTVRLGIGPDRVWRQRVDPDAVTEVGLHDLRSHPGPDPVETHLRRMLSEPFVVDGGVLHRVDVLVVSEGVIALAFAAHHAVCDGFGSELVVARLAQLVAALCRGEDPPPSGFGDYAALVRAERRATDEDTSFWVGHLAGLPPRLTFSDRSITPGAHPLTATTTITAGARPAAGASERWSTMIGLIAAYTAAILDEDEAVLGIPLHNRVTTLERTTPAMVMTELPLRVRVAGATTVDELAERVRRALEFIRPHARTRPETIRHALPSAWRSGRVHGPTVNVFTRESTLTHRGITASAHVVDHGPVQDFSIVVEPGSTGPRLRLSLNPGTYSADDLHRHLERLRTWIDGCLALPPGASLDSVAVLTTDEARRHQSLARPAHRDADAPGDEIPHWGRPTTVAALLDLAGHDRSAAVCLVNRHGRPVITGEVGELAVVRGSHDHIGLGLLAAPTPDGLVFRGRLEDRRLVRGRWVEREARTAQDA